MLEKVEIEKYGPFKKQDISFSDNLGLTYIIGLNDVGKTCLLTAINALNGPLNEHYSRPEINIKKNPEQMETTAIASKVIIQFKINERFYDYDIKENLKRILGDFFTGSIKIERNKTNLSNANDFSIFLYNDNLRTWLEKHLEEINKSLTDKKIETIKIDDLRDAKFEEIFTSLFRKKVQQLERSSEFKITMPLFRMGVSWGNTSQFPRLLVKKSYLSKGFLGESENKIFEKLSVLAQFKDYVYMKLRNRVKYIEANENATFSLIKPEYFLYKDDKKGINDDKELLNYILQAFLNQQDLEFFWQVLKSDNDIDWKENQLIWLCDEATKKMNDFYNTTFPSQDKNVQFKFNLYDARIKWLVKDDISPFGKINERSDGFKWFFKLYVALKNCEPSGVIVIDEPEKFLHPSAQMNLTKMLKEISKQKKIQVICATHSPFMLDFLDVTNIKIVQKDTDKGESVIYNSVQAYVDDSNVDKIKRSDVLSPISNAIGIPYFDILLYNDLHKKVILFVEGAADIHTLELALEIHYGPNKDWIIWPLFGDKKLFAISVAEAMRFKYKIFYDKQESNKRFKNDGQIDQYFTIDQITDNKFTNPEDMLSEETRKKYKLNDKSQHKYGWTALRRDVTVERSHELKDEEVKNLKIYIDGVKKEMMLFNSM